MLDGETTIYLDWPRVPISRPTRSPIFLPRTSSCRRSRPAVTSISRWPAATSRQRAQRPRPFAGRPHGYAEQVEHSLLDSPSYHLIRVLARYKALIADGLDRYGLHLGQEFYLAQLWREDGVTSADLAARTGVSAPAVTKVVSGLERAGLVHRERDASDARLVRVRLTEAGRALREPVTRAWYESQQKFWEGLTEDERAQVRAAVGDLLG